MFTYYSFYKINIYFRICFSSFNFKNFLFYRYLIRVGMIAFCYQTLQAINFTMKEGREVLNGLAGILSTPSSCSHLLLFAPVNRSALNVYDVQKNHVHKTRFKVESNLVVYRDLYHINATKSPFSFE